jgi:hypothetical protein
LGAKHHGGPENSACNGEGCGSGHMSTPVLGVRS